jgi:protein-tyrosine-phosphatase
MPDLSVLGDPFTVLVVCTGNICRSPLAERLGRARLSEFLGSADDAVRIHSAGTRAVVGSAMDPASAQVLRDLGGDPDGFVARQLTEQLVASADLTLTMTRDHRREVLGLGPRALSRTFTLREAADLLELVPEDVAQPRELVRRMAAARSLRAGGREDDVPDPIGRSAEVHALSGQMVAEALTPVLRRLARAVSATTDDGTARLPA